MASNFFKVKTGLNVQPTSSSLVTAQGDLDYNSTSNQLEVYTTTTESVTTTANTQTLTNKTISTGGTNLIGGTAISGVTGTGNLVFSASPTFTGSIVTPVIMPASDSTTAIQIKNAAGSTTVLDIDTTNHRVGIGTTPGSYSLDVSGNAHISVSSVSAVLVLNSNLANTGAQISFQSGGTAFATAGDAGLLITSGLTVTTTDWAVNVGTGRQIVLGVSGVAKAWVDTSGNLNTSGTIVANAASFGSAAQFTVGSTGTVSTSSTISASNLSGTNTGDQTITLTGNVTGSGTGSFATTIANSAVTLAMHANLAANSVIGNSTGSSATPTAVSMTSTVTASSVALRDNNSNLFANNFVESYTSTTTAAATTNLTSASIYQQFFTGTTTQTVTLPAVTGLVLGQQYQIVNNSTGIVTVQSSGANTLQAMAANTQLVATVIAITGTGTASWSWIYTSQAISSGGTLTSLGIFSGKTAISSGAVSQAVTLSTAYGSTGYSVTANLLNTTDTNPQFQPITLTAQSTTGFTASWNAPTATANYVLSWLTVSSN